MISCKQRVPGKTFVSRLTIWYKPALLSFLLSFAFAVSALPAQQTVNDAVYIRGQATPTDDTPPTTAPTPLPGNLEERTGAQHNGAFFYSIPIDLPQGIQKAHPQLRLVYNSQSGNGMLGMGWSLSGLPTIQRTKQIVAIDGVSGSVGYDSDDRFSCQGQRLINISGQYGATGSVYRTEIDTWSKVTANGSAGSGPESFTVVTRRGHVLEFGGTTDSRATALGLPEVRVWHLNQVTDTNGNEVTISYSATPLGSGSYEGRLYPSEIAYTSNTGQKFAANRFVRFQYETRPDVLQRFQGGSGITDSVRLSAIQTFVNTTLVSEYRIKYDTSPTTTRSRVNSIQRFSSSQTTAQGISPATFLWQDGGINSNGTTRGAFDSATTWSDVFTKSNGWDGVKYPLTQADVNGDGILDVIGFKDGTQVALGSASGFQAPTRWINEFSVSGGWLQTMRRRLADVNGDGLADIVGFNNSGVVVSLSKGNAFGQPQSFPYFGLVDGWSPASSSIYLNDVNGDGLADITGFHLDSQVSLSAVDASGNWKGFLAPTQWSSDFGSVNGWNADTPRLMTDLNGDGLADVVGFKSLTMTAALSTGVSFDTSEWDQSFSPPSDWNAIPRMMSDVNGDGLADILGFSANAVMVGLSNGKGFQAMTPWFNGFGSASGWKGKPVMMGDVNGDGMADVIGVDTDGVKIATSTGTQFSDQNWNQNSLPGLGLTQGGTPDQTTRLIVDVNGDGLMDMVGFGINAVSAGLSAGENPDRITGYTRSTGARGTIEYAPLSDPEVYSSQSPSALAHFQNYPPLNECPDFPNYRSRANLGGFYYVVKSYEINNNPSITDSPFTYRYSRTYADGMLNLQGRGWMGFKTLTSTNEELGRVTERQYHQQFPLTGQLLSTTLSALPNVDPSLPQGGIVSAHYPGVDAVVTASGVDKNPNTGSAQQVLDVRRTSSRTDNYDDGKYVSSLAETLSYDDFGNPQVIGKLGLNTSQSLQPAANAVYELNQYVNDATNWRLGYLQYRKSTADNEVDKISTWQTGDLSLEQRTYDDNMNLSTRERWDDTQGAWLTHTFHYDPFGNRTVIQLPSAAVYRTDYETTYNTYPQTKTSPPNQAGKIVVWRYGYDPRFGLLSVYIRPNGQPKVICFDDFGRRSAVQGPAPNASTKLNYDKPGYSSLTTIASGYAPQDVATLTRTTYQWEDDVPVRMKSLVSDWPTSGSTKSFWEKHYADGLGRNYKTTHQDPEKGERVSRLVQVNSMHKILQATLPWFSGDTPVYVTNTYDTLGRILSTSTPAGVDGTATSVHTHAYQETPEGQTITQTSASGDSYAFDKIENYAYAANKKVLQQLVIPSDDNATTVFQCDLLGRLKQIKPPQANAGGAYTYAYDSLGRLKQKTDPARGKFSYRFNSAGYLATRTQANGEVDFTYDSLGRTLSRVYPDDSSVQYTYDAGDNGQGKLTNVSVLAGKTPQTSYAFDFDNYQRKQQVSLTIDGQSTPYVTAKDYDPLGRLVALANPDQSQVTRNFNMDRLTSVTLNGDVYGSFSEYTPMGHFTRAQYKNNVVANRRYSPAGLMYRNSVTGPDSTTLYDKQFTWNHLGELTEIQDLVSKTSSQFSYTNRRLTGSEDESAASSTMGYDPAGNLTNLNGTIYTYSGNQVVGGTRSGSTVFSAGYGPMGNMTSVNRSGISWNYTFDSRNRLVSAQKQGDDNANRYVYDHRGRRVAKFDADGTVSTYVSSWYQEFRQGNNLLKNRTLNGQGGIFAQSSLGQPLSGKPGIPSTSATPLFLHNNYQFSTVLSTDTAGQPSTRLSYDAYGNVTTDGPDNVLFKYTGKELDSETGLYYFNARYYDPVTTRFTRADSNLGGKLCQWDATNSFAFNLNNPTSNIDPTGHSSKSLGCTAAALGLTGTVVSALASPPDGSEARWGKGLSIAGTGLATAGACYQAYMETPAENAADANGGGDAAGGNAGAAGADGGGQDGAGPDDAPNAADEAADPEAADLNDADPDANGPAGDDPVGGDAHPADANVGEAEGPVDDAPAANGIEADEDGPGPGALDGVGGEDQPALDALAPDGDLIGAAAPEEAAFADAAAAQGGEAAATMGADAAFAIADTTVAAETAIATGTEAVATGIFFDASTELAAIAVIAIVAAFL